MIVTLSFWMLFSLCSVYANAEEVHVNFPQFEFITNDYDSSKVYVEYDSVGMSEYAYVRNLDTKELLEVMKVSDMGYRAKDTFTYTFSRQTYFGNTSLQLDVIVELYSSGSFRQINEIKGTYLGIATEVGVMSIEGSSVSVWSPYNKFPTTELYYGYSGTLVSKVGRNTGGSFKADLLKAGFSVSYSQNNIDYFRRHFNSNGRFNLYH